MLGSDKFDHSGPAGRGTRAARQSPYLRPRTTKLGSNGTINLSQTGMDDLTPKGASLDGMCWVAERDNGDQYVLTIDWNVQNEPFVRDCQLLATSDIAEPIIQTGQDWILTRKFFLARREDSHEVYRLQVREHPLLFHDEDIVPPEIGVNVARRARKETNWLYYGVEEREETVTDPETGEERTIRNAPPFWERLNPVIGGYTILHDFLIPRQDYYRQLYIMGGTARNWSRVAIPYEVAEPRIIFENGRLFSDAPNGHWYGSWGMRRGPNDARYNIIPYAVFVMDGEIYIRTVNFFGTARFHPMQVRLGPTGNQYGSDSYHESYRLLNMADLGIWRKNYQRPDDPVKNFDWNNSCMGRIGGQLVLFECAEIDYDPLLLGPMRIAATGRYIPIMGKVAYEDNIDGTVEEYTPPMKWLTDAEAEELMVSLSIITKAEDNKAYGFTPEPKPPKEGDPPNPDPPKPDTEYMLRAYQLDENGDELPPDETRPAYKGVRNHFAVGGNPITGAMGPYVFCNDNAHVFMTDTTGDLRRFVREGKVRPVALRRTELWNPDVTAPYDLLYEDIFMFNGRRGAIDIYYGTSSESQIPWIEPWPDYKWEEKCLAPHSYKLLQAVTGTDVLADALPAWNIPMLYKFDEDSNTVTYAWINPETGEVAEPIVRSFPSNITVSMNVEYNADTEARRVYFRMENRSTNPPTVSEEDLSVPSYLDGWIGMSDSEWYYPGRSRAGGLLPEPVPLLISNDNATPFSVPQYLADGDSPLGFAPTMDFSQAQVVYHRYWNLQENGGTAGAYYEKGLSITSAGFDMFNFDTRTNHRLCLWDEAFLMGLINDGTFLVYYPEHGPDGPRLFLTPNRLHVTRRFWGTTTVSHPVSGVWAAHYVKDKFKLPPMRWADEECTTPIDLYRYEKELIVMKCRSGEADKQRPNSDFPEMPWSAHRYLAFRVDTDAEKYAEMIAPCALQAAEGYDDDYEDEED